MNTWVVAPTYNERDNLEPLVSALVRFSGTNVLIVDDHSPDGTGKLADQLHQRWPQVSVLHRPGKSGLASAYQQGFRQVLDQGAEAVVQMDADLSHDPNLIPKMLEALSQADMVLASRYVPGGSMNIDPWRQLVSHIGNNYIRFMLGRDIRDWSTGYKAWRGDFLRQVMAEPTFGVGYAWLMEMNWQARRLGGRIIEVPMQFRERHTGRSKFNWKIVVEDIRLAWQLRRKS